MSFEIKGWCPGAHRPMMSGDGLVVRVRPRLARLSAAQVLGLCAAARRHGAGLIDLTNRANLQIRGVGQDNWPALIDDLAALDLLDDDPEQESRRNILVEPLWVAGGETHRLALEMLARLPELPDLPAKMGFAIDTGSGPVLRDASADFRFERSSAGRVMLRADGRATGVELAPGTEVDTLIRLARWFIDTGGAQAGRMARHTAPLPDWAQGHAVPALPRAPLAPGPHALGAVHGLAFGQVRAADLAQAMRASGASHLRVTPWRVVLLENAAPGAQSGLLWDADAPELRIDACPGAPFCPQAQGETRDLARRLAPLVTGTLHVSGCAKGCARARAADVVLTARDGVYDLSRGARAGEPPEKSGLTADQILAQFGAA